MPAEALRRQLLEGRLEARLEAGLPRVPSHPLAWRPLGCRHVQGLGWRNLNHPGARQPPDKSFSTAMMQLCIRRQPTFILPQSKRPDAQVAIRPHADHGRCHFSSPSAFSLIPHHHHAQQLTKRRLKISIRAHGPEEGAGAADHRFSFLLDRSAHDAELPTPFPMSRYGQT